MSKERKRKGKMEIKETDRNNEEKAPTVFDTKAFTDELKAQIKAAGGTAAFYKQHDIIKQLTKATFQAMLETEMEEHLGYAENDREAKKEANSRNGNGSKKVRGDFGEITIDTPRDRESTFEPVIIKKRQSSVGDFTDKIISLYARGMTTREIEDHLREMYDIEISPQFVSRATERIQGEITEWQSRPLESVYPVVYVDGLRIAVRSGNNSGSIIKKCVYIVLGIPCSGKQEVLGLWIEENEGAKFWLKVFNDLKARKLEDIILLCGDGLKGLPEAVECVYPKADVQLCVVHQIRNVTKFVSYQDRKKFCADMKPLYGSPTIEAAECSLLEFEQIWGKRYPMAIASWKANWTLLTALYRYPIELRKIIYTTNAIEGLNAQLRKNTSNRKVFPNDDAVIKILFLNIQNFTEKWTKRQGWDKLMNQLSIIFPERLAIGNIAEL
jgi:transposase-like protein